MCVLFLVGGIYTVLKTKTGHMVEQLGDNYLLIGPYNESQVQLEVEVKNEPENSIVAATIRSMRDRGVKVGINNSLICYRSVLFEAKHSNFSSHTRLPCFGTFPEPSKSGPNRSFDIAR